MRLFKKKIAGCDIIGTRSLGFRKSEINNSDLLKKYIFDINIKLSEELKLKNIENIIVRVIKEEKKDLYMIIFFIKYKGEDIKSKEVELFNFLNENFMNDFFDNPISIKIGEERRKDGMILIKAYGLIEENLLDYYNILTLANKSSRILKLKNKELIDWLDVNAHNIKEMGTETLIDLLEIFSEDEKSMLENLKLNYST